MPPKRQRQSIVKASPTYGLWKTARYAGAAAYRNRKLLMNVFNRWKNRSNPKGKTPKRRKYNRLMNLSGGQGGQTTSTFTVEYKRSKAAKFYKIIANKATHQQVKKFSLISGQSLQNALIVDYIANDSDLDAVYESAARFYNATAGAYVTQAASTSSSLSKNFLFDKCDSQIIFVNQSPASAEFDLYLMMNKVSNNDGVSPLTRWNAGLTGSSVGQTTDAYTSPYTKPTISKNFNMYWKIVKKTSGLLEPGAQHKQTFSFKPHRILDMAYVNEFGEINGITYAWMLVIRGVPADDGNTYATPTNIGLTQCKFIGTTKNLYTSQLMSPFPRSHSFTNTLDTGTDTLKVHTDVNTGAVDTTSVLNIA